MVIAVILARSSNRDAREKEDQGSLGPIQKGGLVLENCFSIFIGVVRPCHGRGKNRHREIREFRHVGQKHHSQSGAGNWRH